MRQKFLFLCFILFVSTFSQANAQTVVVQSLNDFSTANPPASISVKLLTPLDLSTTLKLQENTIIKGNLLDVSSPKRLKRNAKFSFKPTEYKCPGSSSQKINMNVEASYTTKLNKAAIAKSAALTVGNHFLKGLSIGVSAIEGAIENEEGNRIKSTARSVYEASPVSYVEKGKDIVINTNDIFYLKFPDVKQVQNYEYTTEKE